MLIRTISAECPFYNCIQYLYFKPEGPCWGIEAVGIEDKIFSTQVKLGRPVAERPGGEAGSSVRHQVQGHVARTYTGQTC